MSGVAKKMRGFAENSSWIRKMFEEGAKMKAEFGADKVFDFSIGNPDVPPPAKFYTVLRELAQNEQPGIHDYMPNAGYPFVREALANVLNKYIVNTFALQVFHNIIHIKSRSCQLSTKLLGIYTFATSHKTY